MQSQLAKLRAAQEASKEAYRREMEARDEAHRQEMARQLQAFAGYLQQIPGVVLPPLPPEMFAPPPPPGPTWTPVSIYVCPLFWLLWSSCRY